MASFIPESRVLHICPDFPNNKLYQLLFSSLSTYVNNAVYVPSKRKVEQEVNYPVDYLERDFGLIDRVIYFRKQHFIFSDIERRKIFKDKQLIHAHTLFSAGYAAWRLYKKYKIPYVVAVRNTDVNTFFRRMVHLRSLGIRIILDSSAVVFISPSYKRIVFENYLPKKYHENVERKCYVIPNGIDSLFLNNEPSLPKQPFDSDRRLRLIYVGEVNTNKNVTTTLRACEILESQGVAPTLTVVGRISDIKLDYIKENRFVQYHNQSPKEEVISYYRQNGIFVMPSLKETFGLVYVEALSQGLPIIYSKGQGFDGYFEDGLVGYAVNSKSPEEIVSAIKKIIGNYPIMSTRCCQEAKAFSWERIATDYDDLYRNIMCK